MSAELRRLIDEALPQHTRLILASDNLLDQWGTRTERGERITVEWGEPTPEGWYEPVFTVHAEDVTALLDRLDVTRSALHTWVDFDGKSGAPCIWCDGVPHKPDCDVMKHRALLEEPR